MLSMCFQANTNVLVAQLQLSNQGPSKMGISSFRLDHGKG